VAAPQLSPELSLSIERCAAALSDLARLKDEVTDLKGNGDGLAHFATALFELEMARRGDSESRARITQLAEVLLVFWRDGSGDVISRLHPALHAQWVSVGPMLVQFELRRFDLALVACWKVRNDPAQLARLIEDLEPTGNRRVEFARCLYHLELARQGVESSRAQFARRAGLIAEAYQDAVFAGDLVGHDPGLLQLWSELNPYLDEFFEALEEQAARAQEGTRKVRIPTAPEMPATRAEVKTDPGLGAPVPSAPPAPAPARTPALGEDPQIPSFRTLLNHSRPLASPPVLQRARPAVEHATPPGGLPEADVLIEEEVAHAPPPPPVDLTPPGSWTPPRTPSGEVEIVDADFEAPPPPPPPMTPSGGLAAAIAEAEDVEFEFEPDDGQKPRMLATESRADRKRLTTWLDGLGDHLVVPEARSFAALVRLILAGETKEKSLFGQENPRRKEALAQAFGLLAPSPEAAGRAAVWFELDGHETREALGRGLDLLIPFLAYCSRHTLDPLSPEARAKYLA